MRWYNMQANTYLCVPCRKSWKSSYANNGSWSCPSCGGEGYNMGTRYRVPPLRNKKAWKQLDVAWDSLSRYREAVRLYDEKHGLKTSQYWSSVLHSDGRSLTYEEKILRRKSLPKIESFLWDRPSMTAVVDRRKARIRRWESWREIT